MSRQPGAPGRVDHHAHVRIADREQSLTVEQFRDAIIPRPLRVGSSAACRLCSHRVIDAQSKGSAHSRLIGVGFVKLTTECAQNLLICAAVVRRFAGSPIQGCIVWALCRADLGATP